MALAGFAYSYMVVSSFSRAQRRVLDMGFADDINTYVMISGKFLNNHKQTISVFSNKQNIVTSSVPPSIQTPD